MATEAFSDFVVGHGELWCAQLVAATCRKLGGACLSSIRCPVNICLQADNACGCGEPDLTTLTTLLSDGLGITYLVIVQGSHQEFVERRAAGDAVFMDTREVIVVTPTLDEAVDVQYDLSNEKLDAWAEKNGIPQIIIATGFIAKNPQACQLPILPYKLVTCA